MSFIFQEGDFSSYSNVNLYESRGAILGTTYYQQAKTTVFISHKHNDLKDLKGIIGFLENNYNVKAYIDSQDPSMPKKISDETAKIIKDRINRCKKFILLATNNAIESKWCNWELGYGDTQKYRDHIALFPMKPRGSYDYQYKGSEYLLIYPYISYYNGTEKYRNGSFITQGYYVNQLSDDGSSTIITPLSTWLNT